MKRMMTFCACAVMATGVALAQEAAAPASQPAYKPIVVRNGSMTTGAAVPQDWQDKFGDCEVARDTEVFKEGPASLRVSVKGGKSGQAYQSFGGKGEQTVRVAGWAKSAGQVKVSVAVQSFDEKWTRNEFKQIKYLQNDTDWTQFSGSVKLPEWTARFNVLLLAEGDGKAWLDEVRDASADKVDTGAPATPDTNAPAKDKPSVPGWGFWPAFPKGWMQMHRGFLERTQKGDIDVIFFGDSITQGWDKDVWKENFGGLKAVNYGIGGDSTRQVLYRIQNGEVDGISPKVVVLMIGTNNLYGDHNSGSDAEIAEGVTTIVKTLQQKLPQTKILLLAILPRENAYFTGRIANINKIISKLDDGSSVRYLDMGTQFQTELGKVIRELYNPDQLHLVKKGYEVIARNIKPLMAEMMK